MIDVFQGMLAHMDRGECCVLVSAVGGEGSAPRKIQSHMLVSQLGRVCGTVGGGAVEGSSLARAAQLLKEKKSNLQTFELYEHARNDIGMICGGKVQVHFQFVHPHDMEIRKMISEACAALSEGRDAWLLINLTAHVLSVFDGSVVHGACVPDEFLSNMTASAQRCTLSQTEYYIEQLSYSDRVYIFGGGHVAQALVPVLASVGFRCVIIEDREEFCRRELFPQAQDVQLLTQQEWEEKLHIEKSDCICIMTRGHQNDLACQAFALHTQAGYIGVIGSKRKVAFVNDQLREMGFDEQQIARIVTPIGLEIGAVTPAEIAISIAAQMIAHRASSRKNSIKKSCMA